MPTTFGNTAFQDARDSVMAELDALVSYMTTNSVSPKFDAAYDTHWETPAPDFYAVTCSIAGVTHTDLAPNKPEFIYTVECRILTGNENSNFEEEIFYNLANSLVNWFFTHGASMTDNFRFKPTVPIQVVPNLVFSDIKAIGGTVTFTIFGVEEYTPA